MKPVVLLVPEGALTSSLALPLEMLHAAAQHLRARTRRAPPAFLLAGEREEPLGMAGGLVLASTVPAERVAEASLAIVPSLWRRPHLAVRAHPRLSACLDRLAASGTVICAVGTGSYFLAEGGWLDGRPATTHASFLDDFARRYPAVRLQRRHLITRSGGLYCAGSVNAVADLVVHFADRMFGAAAARHIEGQFSPEIRRPFATQGFVEGEAGAHPDEAVRLAQDEVLARLAGPLRVAELARAAGLSPRSLARRFRAATGMTPVGFLQEARLRAARELLRSSNLTVAEVGARCGYPDASHFSRAFAARTGSTPQAYRRQVRGKLFSGAGEGWQ